MTAKPVPEPVNSSFPTDDFVPVALRVAQPTVAQDDCKPEDKDSLWKQANTKFEEVYEKVKYGACTWKELDVAYEDMEKASILLAQEMNKNPARAREAVKRVTEDLRPNIVIQESDTDEEAIKMFENFFFLYNCEKSYTFDEAAKEKIKMAEDLIEKFEHDDPQVDKILKNTNIEERKKRLEKAVRQFKLWKKTVEEDLYGKLPALPLDDDEYDDLPELIPIAQANLEPSEWCCPTCSAVWKTK